MTDKEVKQLSRSQLITLLAEVTGENEELRNEVERLKDEIEKLSVTNEKLESLADLSRQILDRISIMQTETAEQNDSDVVTEKAGPQSEDSPATETESDTMESSTMPGITDRAVPRFLDVPGDR